LGLIDDIRKLVEERKLPRIWRIEDLINSELGSQYNRANMQSQPTNRSVSPDLQDKGAGVNEPDSAPFFRFKPGGKRGMYICLKSHYVAGRDPSTLLEPFTFDPAQEYFSEGSGRETEPFAPGGAKPNDAPTSAGGNKSPDEASAPSRKAPEVSIPSERIQGWNDRMARACEWFEARRFADCLACLDDLLTEVLAIPGAEDLAALGFPLGMAGLCWAARGQIELGHALLDHALRAFLSWNPVVQVLLMPPEGASRVRNLPEHLLFECALALHARWLQDIASDGLSIEQSLAGWRHLETLYNHCDRDDRFLALALVAHAAYSGRIRSVIPLQSDHGFRSKAIGDSGPNRSPIPLSNRSRFRFVPESAIG
jgi:hypothetical protein